MDIPLRQRRLFVLMVLVAIVGCQSPPPKVTGSRLVGEVANPATTIVRDGGASVAIGGKLLWTFGDSLFPKKSVDGTNGRSNSAAYAALDRPTVLTEPLDANGAPSPLLPFTAEEQRYNDSSGRPDERIALWPSVALPLSADRALIVYDKLYVRPGDLNYETIGTGLAEIDAGSTVARRMAGLLFQAPEPSYFDAAIIDDNYLYLFGCERNGLDAMCRMARAPIQERANRAAYMFWTGRGFVSDAKEAKATIPGSTSGFSIAWNAYLKRYVAVMSTGFAEKVTIRIASRLEGPWSDPIDAHAAGGRIYAATQHPALARDGGKTIAISYYQPTGPLSGALKLVEVTFS